MQHLRQRLVALAPGGVFALPVAGSQPKRTPLPWDAAAPHRGLGFREVEAKTKAMEYAITEFPVQKG